MGRERKQELRALGKRRREGRLELAAPAKAAERSDWEAEKGDILKGGPLPGSLGDPL